MCSTSSPCQPLQDHKTRKHRGVVCGAKAALSTGFEYEMAPELTRAYFAGLSGAYLTGIKTLTSKINYVLSYFV